MRFRRRDFLSAGLATGLLASLGACGGGGSSPAPAPAPVSNIELKLLAGGNALEGGFITPPVDGIGSAATFGLISAAAVDASGNIYVLDLDAVRQITPSGVVTTIAGTAFGQGYVNAVGSAARFYAPNAIAVDPSGNILVSDGSNTIRLVTPTGSVSTLIGANNGVIIPTQSLAVQQPEPAIQMEPISGTLATLTSGGSPVLSVDRQDNIYLFIGNQFLKIDPAGVATVVAGSKSAGNVDGVGRAAMFTSVAATAIDASGNLFVAESIPVDFQLLGAPALPGKSMVRQISPAGVVTSLAGGVDGVPNVQGNVDGPAASAEFRALASIAVDLAGDVYVVDQGDETVRKVASDGTVSTVVGASGNTKVMLGHLPAQLGLVSAVVVSGNSLVITTATAVLVTSALP